MTAPLHHPLDHVAWTSLTGPHAGLAVGSGRARRYHPELSPFAALAPGGDPGAWDDLRALVAAGETVVLFGDTPRTGSLPAGWEVVAEGAGVQMTATDGLVGAGDAEVLVLGDADVPEMLDLVARTEPGPFTARTPALGTYRGIRHGGRLVAMAGERMHPAGWTEISAVCTDPELRGRGLAARVVLAVVLGVRARGETPLLHAAASNVGGIRLYGALGFTQRCEMVFSALRAGPAPGSRSPRPSAPASTPAAPGG